MYCSPIGFPIIRGKGAGTAKAYQILKEVSEMKEGIRMTQIPNYRSEYLVLNSAGINIICRIGYFILSNDEKFQHLDEYVDKMATIDWKKAQKYGKGILFKKVQRVLQKLRTQTVH